MKSGRLEILGPLLLLLGLVLRLCVFSKGGRERERASERASERERSRTGVLELRFHAVSLADSEMDVRFFPAPPSSVGSCTLPTDSGLDYYHPNKVIFSTLLIAHSCPDVRSSMVHLHIH